MATSSFYTDGVPNTGVEVAGPSSSAFYVDSEAAAAAATAAATAAVAAAAGTATPLVDGTAAVGTSPKWAHEDHVHPTGTNLQAGEIDLVPSITNKVQASSASADSLLAIGQSTSSHLEFIWRHNAAPASAYVAVATYGYSNPIHIDASSITLNASSGGSVTAPTPTAGDNSTKVATTAFVMANSGSTPATAVPLADGTAAVGVSTKYAREDHVHPTDTTRAPLNAPVFTGTVSFTGPAAFNNGQALNWKDSVGASGQVLLKYTDDHVYLDNGTPGKNIYFRTGGFTVQAVMAPSGWSFIQSPTAPTPTAGDNSTKLATTAFVLANATATGAVRYDTAQSLTATQQSQARANIAVMGRNTIINGDFRINERGYTSGASLAAGAYAHDRWKAGSSGCTYTFTQLKSSTQITISSGTLVQVVEDANVVGGTYVLSWTGTAQARVGVNTASPSGAYAASPIVVTGQTAGTVMSVEFGAGTLSNVQLEVGSVPTPFEYVPFPIELHKAQRYFEVISAASNGSMATGVAHVANSSRALLGLTWKVMKRVPPTLSLSAISHWAFLDPTITSYVVWSSFTANSVEWGGILDVNTVTAGLGSAGTATMSAPNAANPAARIFIDAEL